MCSYVTMIYAYELTLKFIFQQTDFCCYNCDNSGSPNYPKKWL